jgi:PmbA protein
MIVRDLVERAAAGAEGAQAVMQEVESTNVSFENDRLKAVNSSQSTSITVRVVVKGRLGVSRTTDPSDGAGVVDRALEAAEFGAPVHFSFPPPREVPEVRVFDEAVTAVTRGEMIKLGEAMIVRVKDYNKEILLGAGVSRSISRNKFANSAGTLLSEKSTGFSLHVHGQLVRGTDILWAGHGFGWKKREIDERAVADRTVELFRMAEKTVDLESAEMPVIFTPEGVNVLLLALRLGCNGKNVLLGASPLAGKLGEKVAGENFSLTDDPLIDYGGGTAAYDGEGVPHGVTPLIEKGVVKNFLYDLDTAGRAGTESTGNGIGCDPTNLVVARGMTPFEEMVKGTKKGLLVHSVIGLGQGNPLSGEFSVNVHLGYKIEEGQITGRVKNVMLAGNTYEALKNIDAIGDRAEWVGGRLLTPPVKISRLSVVG